METKACTVCSMNCLKLHGDEDEDADRNKRMLDSSRGRKKDAASHLLPSFLKKMTEVAIKSKLQMPVSFVRNSVTRIGKTIILEGPSTNKWSVEVWPGSVQKRSLEFRDGWQKFVKDHNLQIGDQLCFTLTSDSHFQVMVYDESGSQKASAMDAINSTVTIKHEPKHLSKVRSDVRTKGPEARLKQKVTKRIRIKSAVKPTVVVVHSSDSELGNSEPPEKDENLKEIISKEKIQDCPGMDGSLADPKPLLAPHILQGGHVVSQRRSVTPAEKERALNAARDLADTLTNPKLVMVMTKAYVYKGFWMVLNKVFSNAHMPHESREVTLCNKAGHSWPVKWLFKTTTNSSGFSGGWRGFALDNRLEESDVCVFEMVDEKYFVILVHLFRAIGQPSEDAGDYRPSPGRGRNANRRKRKAIDSPLDTRCTKIKLFHSGDLKSPAGCSRAKYLYHTQSQEAENLAQMVGCSQKQQKDTCTASHGKVLHQDEGKEVTSTAITSSCDTDFTSDNPSSEALETFERRTALQIRPLHAFQFPRRKTGSFRDYLMDLGKELVGQQAAMAAPKRSSPPASRKTQISPSLEV